MNKMTTRKKHIEDSAARVMEAIKHGEVKMTPAWHFTLRSVFFIGGTALLFGLSVYFVSLILFIVTGNALQALPWLGMPGIFLFASSLPWALIVLSIMLVVLLEFFSTQLRVVYRRPLVYSSLTLLILVIAGGSLISQTTLHERLLRLSQEGRMPLGKTYGAYVLRNPEHMHVGKILSLTDEDFVLLDRLGRELQVHMTPTIRKPQNLLLKEGAFVVVIGDGEEVITARGIHSLKDARRLFPRARAGQMSR
jgi:hypothetical protein